MINQIPLNSYALPFKSKGCNKEGKQSNEGNNSLKEITKNEEW